MLGLVWSNGAVFGRSDIEIKGSLAQALNKNVFGSGMAIGKSITTRNRLGSENLRSVVLITVTCKAHDLMT